MRNDGETEKTGAAKNDNGPLEIFRFLSLMFLRGTRTGNSVLSHNSLKLDTAIGKPCGIRRDAQANQIKFKRRLQRQMQVQSCKSDRHGLHSFCPKC